ncbi:MAG TPA: hypothetical protein VIH85_29365 [Solirubrobacteraceae bacterium]
MSFRAFLRVRSMLPLAIIVGGLISLTQAAPASAFPVINIHLMNAPSYCVNRQGGGNSQGTNVFLYACSAGNVDWYEAQYVDINGNIYCDGNCWIFEDYWNTSECFALGNNDEGTLEPCGAEQTEWGIDAGNVLRNLSWGQDLFTVNDANRSPLSGNPQPIDWHQWTGP